jgi:hypothetical protein
MTLGKHSEKDEDIIRGFVEYTEEYLSLDKDRLVLFAVSQLESKRIEPTFDKIVVAAFKLFPKKFSLIGFQEYPDGRTIYYCVYNHCTLDKKWLFGNVQSAFKLTERGRYFLDETQKMLEGKIVPTRTHQISPRRKETTFISILKKTKAYEKYLQDDKSLIDKSELLEALRVPSESKALIQANLTKYLEYAQRINEPSVVKFLEFARGKLEGEGLA